jgi:hypothetical protein
MFNLNPVTQDDLVFVCRLNMLLPEEQYSVQRKSKKRGTSSSQIRIRHIKKNQNILLKDRLKAMCIYSRHNPNLRER